MNDEQKTSFRNQVYVEPGGERVQPRAAPPMTTIQLVFLQELIKEHLAEHPELADRDVQARRSLQHRLHAAESRLASLRMSERADVLPHSRTPTVGDIAVTVVRTLLRRITTGYIKANVKGITDIQADRVVHQIEDIYVTGIPTRAEKAAMEARIFDDLDEYATEEKG